MAILFRTVKFARLQFRKMLSPFSAAHVFCEFSGRKFSCFGKIFPYKLRINLTFSNANSECISGSVLKTKDKKKQVKIFFALFFMNLTVSAATILKCKWNRKLSSFYCNTKYLPFCVVENLWIACVLWRRNHGGIFTWRTKWVDLIFFGCFLWFSVGKYFRDYQARCNWWLFCWSQGLSGEKRSSNFALLPWTVQSFVIGVLFSYCKKGISKWMVL